MGVHMAPVAPVAPSHQMQHSPLSWGETQLVCEVAGPQSAAMRAKRAARTASTRIVLIVEVSLRRCVRFVASTMFYYKDYKNKCRNKIGFTKF